MKMRQGSGLYLKTPKRYAGRDNRKAIVSLRWLWLYLIAPIIIIPAALAWQMRGTLSQELATRVPVEAVMKRLNPPAPTITPTPIPDPSAELQRAFDAGRVSKAVVVLQSVTNGEPNQVRYFSLLAQMKVLRSYGTNKTMLAEAVEAAKGAINANPDAVDGWLMTAMALSWSGKPQEALPYALRARDLDEKNALVAAVTAEIYVDLKRYEAANKLITSALELARTSQPVNRAAYVHAHYVMARLYEDSGADPKLAVAEYERSWRFLSTEPVDPTIPVGYVAVNLAVSYRNSAKADQAIKLLSEAQKRDQDDPIIAYQLGVTYLNLGDRNKARAYAENCRDLDPDRAVCLRLLSRLQYFDGNWVEVIKLVDRLIQAKEADAGDYYRSGSAYGEQNQCASAVPMFITALEILKPSEQAIRGNIEERLRACGGTVPPPRPATPTATPSK